MKLFVVVSGQVKGPSTSTVFVNYKVRIVMTDPLNRDHGVLIHSAGLLEEALHLRQAVELSGGARDDSATFGDNEWHEDASERG